MSGWLVMAFQCNLAMYFAEHKLILIFAITIAITIQFHREVIVQGSVRWPNGLALDLVLDRS